MSSLMCCGDHVLFEVSSGPGPVPGGECDFVDACDDFPGVGERGVVAGWAFHSLKMFVGVASEADGVEGEPVGGEGFAEGVGR